MTSSSDQNDDFGLPTEEDAAALIGAAADSGNLDDRLKDLPRILRYAIMSSKDEDHVPERLIAEIDELTPGLAETKAFAACRETDTGLQLAAALDFKAAAADKPELRSLADSVRLICLPTTRVTTFISDHRRVGKALLAAFQRSQRELDDELCCDLERYVFGWAALPACADVIVTQGSASYDAASLGATIARNQVRVAAGYAVRRSRSSNQRDTTQKEIPTPAPSEVQTSRHSLIVARLAADEMKNTKVKEILGPLKGGINQPLPLIEVPDLHRARSVLVFEFPYAIEAIDFVLSDLVGRATVHIRPLLLVGDVGGGKTRFVRRLGEVLGLPISRYDASRADGAVFGGTDRRWYSAEPCHPFLAVVRGRAANPMVLIDEIDKAATRNDYGRLWDCLLGFLEPETNARYPDPALQIDLELSQISYAATANDIEPLPSPIRDRFRIVHFPKPGPEHLEVLLPAVTADLARERGYDSRWANSIDQTELKLLAHHWHGGSVRKLRQLVEAILRDREINATRH